MHDIIEGKSTLSNRTNANVFGLLSKYDIPSAFIRKVGSNSFLAHECRMVPYEVVVRREAHGSSYLKRYPGLAKGHRFDAPRLEFFLKTSGRQFEGYELPADDPLIRLERWGAYLYHPARPMAEGAFLTMENFPLKDSPMIIGQMGEVAVRVFLILETAWRRLGKTLVDFKVEFGFNTAGFLLLADVIDNDSWRLLNSDGEYMDKQIYRNGGDLDTVLAAYREVADLTDQF